LVFLLGTVPRAFAAVPVMFAALGAEREPGQEDRADDEDSRRDRHQHRRDLIQSATRTQARQAGCPRAGLWCWYIRRGRFGRGLFDRLGHVLRVALWIVGHAFDPFSDVVRLDI
jgi:hypothetical protein